MLFELVFEIDLQFSAVLDLLLFLNVDLLFQLGPLELVFRDFIFQKGLIAAEFPNALLDDFDLVQDSLHCRVSVVVHVVLLE